MHHLANAAHFLTSGFFLKIDIKKRVAIASSGGGYCPFGQSFYQIIVLYFLNGIMWSAL